MLLMTRPFWLSSSGWFPFSLPGLKEGPPGAITKADSLGLQTTSSKPNRRGELGNRRTSIKAMKKL